MNEKIYIILPVHNRRKITEKFIDCLLAQSYTNYHLILVDDGSNDGTDDMVKSKIQNLSILKGSGNWWWAGSLQQGIDWINVRNVDDRDIVLFANDDITFANDFFEIAVQLMDKQPGMLLPQVLNQKTGKIEESGVYADFKQLKFLPAESTETINCLPTRGLFMRMADLRKVGNFYPRMLPHYLSDYEFTIRAYRKGVHLWTSPKLHIQSDDDATGYRNFEGASFFEFLKKYFSKKSANNPFYWTVFIFLISPKLYIPWHLIKVWLGSLKTILKHAVHKTVPL